MGFSASYEKIKKSQTRINQYVRNTPLYELDHDQTNMAKKLVKFENMQVTGSYKIRGALNKIIMLSNSNHKKGVVTASTGNHGLGLLKASSMFDIDAKVVIPHCAPRSKVKKCKKFADKLIVRGQDYGEAKKISHEIEEEENRIFISSYNDIDVVIANGTVALEVIDDDLQVDRMFVPIGGGGLISGVCKVLAHFQPDAEIVGVQACRANTVIPSLNNDAPVRIENVDTIADGIAVNKLGKDAFDTIKKHVHEFELVSRTQMEATIRTFATRENQILEPAGAAAVAAMFDKKDQSSSEVNVAIATGGNVRYDLLKSLI